jgi:hypothetical protein
MENIIIIRVSKADIIGRGWSKRLQFGEPSQVLQIRSSGHNPWYSQLKTD